MSVDFNASSGKVEVMRLTSGAWQMVSSQLFIGCMENILSKIFSYLLRVSKTMFKSKSFNIDCNLYALISTTIRIFKIKDLFLFKVSDSLFLKDLIRY